MIRLVPLRSLRLGRSFLLRSGVLLSFALTFLGLAAPPATAQIVRNFTPRFSINTRGEILPIGNTVMSCSGGGGCTNARNGNGGNVNNNNWNMQYVDADGDGSTFSSSSAQLALPGGTAVLWAGLYWGGDTNNAQRTTVRFRGPGAAGYTSLIATQLDVDGTVYSCFRDVTALVQAAGNGTYWAADVRSTVGTNRFAGWSLIVVYGDPAVPNRNLVVSDGFAEVAPNTSVILTLGGFITPPAGPVQTRIGVVSYEGDLGYSGDAFQLNGNYLQDAVNPQNNFFTRAIGRLGAHVGTKTPNYRNQLGFDCDLMNANGILSNSSTSATLRLWTGGDRYYPTAVTFATDLYAPVLEGNSFVKSVVDVNGAPSRPGDVLEYSIVMRNTGQDNAVQTVLRDTILVNASYVAGSLSVVNGPNAGAKTDGAGDDQAEYVAADRSVVVRLGTGATAVAGGTITPGVQTTVRFRVQVGVPAPNGSTLSNQGALAFNAAQLGTAFNTRSDGDTIAPGYQPTISTVTAPMLSGTVFEDVQYGGGSGRSLVAAGGAPRPGARVELYDAAGTYRAADTTDAAGLYAFDGWSPGAYTVRAVSGTVSSSRTGGGTPGLVPVQTFRATAPAGTAVADAQRVGGEDPSRVDVAANLASATLASLSTATTVAQSVAGVVLATANIPGIDFGFNFDTIVSPRDAGQGSLRQFLLNANALANTGLAQVGQSPGVETSLFMVPDGAAHPGLRAGLPSGLTGGVIRIAPTGALPALTAASTRLDGSTQTTHVGDTNAGLLGAGGTVGVDALALATVAAPEVEIVDGGGGAVGLDLAAASLALVGFSIHGFGNAADSDGHADVRLSAGATGAMIERCVLGAGAASFTAPPAAERSGGDLVRAIGAGGGTLSDCLLGFAAGHGVALRAGAVGWIVTGNELRGNGTANAQTNGVELDAGATATLRGNLFADQQGSGLDVHAGSAGVTIENNTLTRSGLGPAAGAESPGIRMLGSDNLVDRNRIFANVGAGMLIGPGAQRNRVTRNSMFDNGTMANLLGEPMTDQIGIDLLSAADDDRRGTAPFVTVNDPDDSDAGGNELLNFPVLDQAVLSGGNLTLTGWSRPGTTLEFYLSDGDPGGFGEGRTHVVSLVEGSVQDLDGTVSAYTGLLNGLNQGSDITNRFRFTMALPPGVLPGSALTATAYLAAAGTSEFSGRVVVGAGVSVSGFAYADLDHDAARDAGEPGTGAALWVKLVPEPPPAIAGQVVSVDPGTGAFSFGFVSTGSYTLVLDDNADPADVTPTYPNEWIGTEAEPGVRPAVAVVGAEVVNQNFGRWHGSRIEGRVFRDDGAGGAPGATANDGIAQAAEAALAAVRLRLTSLACAGGVCDSTLTDGAGAYRLWLPFPAAVPGVAVVEVNPAGWLSTGADVGTTTGTYDRAADAVTFVAAPGVVYTGASFGDVPPNAFAAPGATTVAAGAPAFYPHTFTAGSAGSVSFGVTQTPSPALPGWSVELRRDVNCNGVLDAGEPILSAPVALSAGQSLCLILRHGSPVGGPPGASEDAALTAGFVYTGAAPPLSAASQLSDRTTLSAAGGGLVLTKTVSAATALPGDVLTYTITYTNLSAAALTTIEIADTTPAHTVFETAACGALGGGLAVCAVTTQPGVGAAGPVTWTLTGSLAPGASGSVTFEVRVQ